MNQADHPSITLTTDDVAELANDWAQLLIDNTPKPKQPDEFSAIDYVELMAQQGVTLSTMTAARKLSALEDQKLLTSRRVGLYRYYRKADKA